MGKLTNLFYSPMVLADCKILTKVSAAILRIFWDSGRIFIASATASPNFSEIKSICDGAMTKTSLEMSDVFNVVILFFIISPLFIVAFIISQKRKNKNIKNDNLHNTNNVSIACFV